MRAIRAHRSQFPQVRPRNRSRWAINIPWRGEQRDVCRLSWIGCSRQSLGADLTRGTWLWGDGSLPALTKTIAEGVMSPKEHSGVMPPMGGASLSPADLNALSAYVWAIGHATQK